MLELIGFSLFSLIFIGFSMLIWRQKNKIKNLELQIHHYEKDQSLLTQQITFKDELLLNQANTNKILEEKFQNFFKQYAQEALIKNQSSFLEVAKTAFEQIHTKQKHDLELRQSSISKMVDPVHKTLSEMDAKLKTLEKERTVAYVDLRSQVSSLIESQKELQQETSSLVKALRNPSTRGQWGEIQLKRVVELAGMIEHCDFMQQETAEISRLRPDMIIKLPGQKQVIVDAKTPLAAYLNALEAKDENERHRLLQDHARQVRVHIKQLSQKSYWEQFENAPEFVVMFLPSESLLSAALEKDASLIEFGANERVIMATPTTLIALLRAISYGWRQENIHDSVKNIIDLGQEIYKRFNTFSDYFVKLGRNLNQSVTTYNQTLNSVESRLLPVMRKIQDVKSIKTDVEIPIFSPIETQIKQPHTMELQNDKDDA